MQYFVLFVLEIINGHLFISHFHKSQFVQKTKKKRKNMKESSIIDCFEPGFSESHPNFFTEKKY